MRLISQPCYEIRTKEDNFATFETFRVWCGAVSEQAFVGGDEFQFPISLIAASPFWNLLGSSPAFGAMHRYERVTRKEERVEAMKTAKLLPGIVVAMMICSAVSQVPAQVPAQAPTAPMTPEEQMVRVNYAKLAYATRMGVLVNNVLSTTNVLNYPAQLQKQMDAQLRFAFQSVTVGNLADIANTRWDSLVTKPQQDLIAVAPANWPYTLKLSKSTLTTRMNYAMASWNRYNDFDRDWSMPTKEAIAMLPKETLRPDIVYSRYAAYIVTATLEGKQRTYNAIFLFGKNPDGTEAVYPIDHVLGMGVLNYIMANSMYPQPLLETHLREWPGVRDWAASASVPSASQVQDVSCDASSGKCGIPAQVLTKALSLPIDPESRQFTPKTGPAPQAVSPPPTAQSVNPTPATPTSCNGYSTDVGYDPNPSGFGTTDHRVGYDHQVSITATGSCVYSSSGSANCNTQCGVSGTAPVSGDLGGTVTGYCHVVGVNWQSGSAAAVNGGASCSGLMSGGTSECTTSLCDCTVSVSAAGLVTGNPQVIWTLNDPIPLACNTEPDPTHTGDGGGNGGCTGGSVKCQDPPSPIIVDTTGHGFLLTSAEDGVRFDFYGDGHPIKLSWTADDSGNAFLALDRNHNGKIDDAKELFGNITEQPESTDPNGYLALAEFDKPENGGNGDGIIDSRDAVYSKLLLWIDKNHDGISQPEELHTLPELGVFSISLRYRSEPLVDKYGNSFRYRGVLNPDAKDGESKDGRYTYDVFFVPDKTATVAAKFGRGL
jgi:hypothetical protein